MNLLAKMQLKLVTASSPLDGFSWNRVRYMLARHEELIQKKAMFAHEGMVFMEMLYSDCLLVMFPGQRHVGIAARNEWNRPRLKALPPKDVEQAVAVLMQKYGRGGLKEAELFH